MAEHAIQGLMDVTMQRVKELVDSNSIIGAPITAGDITILPVSKVTFGYAGGGSDFNAKTSKELFGGGSGAGVSITPVGFLVISKGDVRIIQMSEPNSVERLVAMTPDLINKVTSTFKKDSE